MYLSITVRLQTKCQAPKSQREPRILVESWLQDEISPFRVLCKILRFLFIFGSVEERMGGAYAYWLVVSQTIHKYLIWYITGTYLLTLSSFSIITHLHRHPLPQLWTKVLLLQIFVKLTRVLAIVPGVALNSSACHAEMLLYISCGKLKIADCSFVGAMWGW